MFTTEAGKSQKALYGVKSQMQQSGRTGHLSSVLSKSKIGLERVDFDPTNIDHRLIFARFLSGAGWKDGITFHVEAPHMTVPATVINKLLVHHLAEEIAFVKIEAETGLND